MRKFQKFLSLLCAGVMCTVIGAVQNPSVFAVDDNATIEAVDSGEYATYSWAIYNNDDKIQYDAQAYTLSLSGAERCSVQMSSMTCPFTKYSSKITRISIEDGVSAISFNTRNTDYKLFTNVHSITFASSVKEVMLLGFDGLKELTIPYTVTDLEAAFITNLESLTIQNPTININSSRAFGYTLDSYDVAVINTKLCVHCQANSTAEKFCQKYEIAYDTIRYYPSFTGDVNSDSKIDTDDAIMVMKYYAAEILNVMPYSLTEQQKLAADVNQNGVIDTDDAVCIMKYYAKAILGEVAWEDVVPVK